MAFLPPPNLPLVPQSGIYDRRGLQKKYASPVRGRLGGGTGKPSPHPSLSGGADISPPHTPPCPAKAGSTTGEAY